MGWLDSPTMEQGPGVTIEEVSAPLQAQPKTAVDVPPTPEPPPAEVLAAPESEVPVVEPIEVSPPPVVQSPPPPAVVPPTPVPVPVPAPAPVPVPEVEEDPSPPPPTEPPVPSTAAIRVTGDAARVHLVEGTRRISGGRVPPGTYTIEVVFRQGEAVQQQGEITLGAGQSAIVKCQAAFYRCSIRGPW
jgi:hypothetical protein